MLAATSSYNMTDPLSVTASLVGLVDFATRVVRGASVNRRPAKKDRIDILDEVNLYTTILHEVAEHTRSTSPTTQRIVIAGVELCSARLDYLQFAMKYERKQLAPKGVEKAAIGFIRSVSTLRGLVME